MGAGQQATYRIKVKGRLDRRWSDWFDGLEITYHTDEAGLTVTTMTGPVADQSALLGILINICNLNLELLSVEQV